MSDHTAQPGFRMVKPSKRRKQKDTPSRRARDARKLVERIEARTSERHEIWQGTDPLPHLAQRVGADLAHLHGEKRAMRRDIYADAPQLEGRPVFKGIPGGRS